MIVKKESYPACTYEFIDWLYTFCEGSRRALIFVDLMEGEHRFGSFERRLDGGTIPVFLKRDGTALKGSIEVLIHPHDGGIQVEYRCSASEHEDRLVAVLVGAYKRFTKKAARPDMQQAYHHLKTPGGRPRDEISDQAYQMLVEGLRREDVYHWWYEEKKKRIKGFFLEDPDESFKKAMNYREKTEKRE